MGCAGADKILRGKNKEVMEQYVKLKDQWKNKEITKVRAVIRLNLFSFMVWRLSKTSWTVVKGVSLSALMAIPCPLRIRKRSLSMWTLPPWWT